MIRALAPVVAAVVVLSGSGASASVAEPLPAVMAALGDSISAGFNACGWYVACRSRSWSAGDNAQVSSHYGRLAARSRELSGHNRNFAVPGATSADLLGQVRQAVSAKAGYVTILIGAQDACVSSERVMTPVEVYRRRVDEALAELRAGLPEARVFVASIPDMRRLWRVGKDNAIARSFWTIGRICPAMLVDPTSRARKDVNRRARVRARLMDYNSAFATACAAYGPLCRTDGGAVFSFPFTLDHISKWDFFHPNAEGQRVLARETFARGFDWADQL